MRRSKVDSSLPIRPVPDTKLQFFDLSENERLVLREAARIALSNAFAPSFMIHLLSWAFIKRGFKVVGLVNFFCEEAFKSFNNLYFPQSWFINPTMVDLSYFLVSTT